MYKKNELPQSEQVLQMFYRSWTGPQNLAAHPPSKILSKWRDSMSSLPSRVFLAKERECPRGGWRAWAGCWPPPRRGRTPAAGTPRLPHRSTSRSPPAWRPVQCPKNIYFVSVMGSVPECKWRQIFFIDLEKKISYFVLSEEKTRYCSDLNVKGERVETRVRYGGQPLVFLLANKEIYTKKLKASTFSAKSHCFERILDVVNVCLGCSPWCCNMD